MAMCHGSDSIVCFSLAHLEFVLWVGRNQNITLSKGQTINPSYLSIPDCGWGCQLWRRSLSWVLHFPALCTISAQSVSWSRHPVVEMKEGIF